MSELNPFLAGIPTSLLPAPTADQDYGEPAQRMKPNDSLQTYTHLRHVALRHALVSEDAGGEANAFSEWYVKPLPNWCDERPIDLAAAFRKWRKETQKTETKETP